MQKKPRKDPIAFLMFLFWLLIVAGMIYFTCFLVRSLSEILR